MINLSKNPGVLIISKKYINRRKLPILQAQWAKNRNMCVFCKQSKDFHSNHNHSCSYFLLILQQSDFLQGNIKMFQDFEVCINADNCRLSWLPGIMQKHRFFSFCFYFYLCLQHVNNMWHICLTVSLFSLY